MPVLHLSKSGPRLLQPRAFSSERELEDIVNGSPELLSLPGEASLAVVDRQVALPGAGILDLLLTDAEGRAVVAEVKLFRNGESRREIVAQAIDYVSALTRRTVDEVDQQLKGKLEKVLRGFSGDEDPEDRAFERRWLAFGANLRAAQARVVLVLDDAPEELVRIVQFLRESSRLDIRLVVVTRYADGAGEDIVVPTPLVSRAPDREVAPKTPRPEFGAVLAEYDKLNPAHPTTGGAAAWRQIRLPGLPAQLHYEFMDYRTDFGVEVHIESDEAKPAKGVLDGLLPTAKQRLESLGFGVSIDPKWSSNRGRLVARSRKVQDPVKVAKAMVLLMEITEPALREMMAPVAKDKTSTG